MAGLNLDRDKEMSDNEAFFQNLPQNLHHFEGCGNQLGVVPLTLAGYEGTDESWKKDARLRKILTSWGKKINSDSVMILFGDPRKSKEQGYDVKMFVFEPSGDDGSGLGGGISTMCGNGIRAVAAWVQELEPERKQFRILSMSGMRIVDEENNLFTVRMGEFANSAKSLSAYVDSRKVLPNKDGVSYLDSPIPQSVLEDLSKFTSADKWSIGLNGTREPDDKIDGEPHIVIEIPESEVKDIKELRRLAVAAGPLVSKRLDLFPLEINVNFIVVKGTDGNGKFEIWNCTHERNLGSDADHSVTAACGTGSTVAGGFMFIKYVKHTNQIVLVNNTGGDLEIALDKKDKFRNLLMKGPASRVK